MDLKITKEKVLEAANKCNIAKTALEVLFPEAFIDNSKPRFRAGKEFDHFRNVMAVDVQDSNRWVVCVAGQRELGDHFELSEKYDWKLEPSADASTQGRILLKATKK